MSLWRKEASRRLPELQAVVADTSVKTPSDLWMALYREFDRLCHQQPPPIDLLSRIWDYAKWSAQHKDESVEFAAINFFFEEIRDTKVYREVLPRFMNPKDYAQYTGQGAPGKTPKA
jgi:hypothetical protein